MCALNHVDVWVHIYHISVWVLVYMFVCPCVSLCLCVCMFECLYVRVCPVNGHIPPPSRLWWAGQCPGGRAGRAAGCPLGARGWCRPSQWSPPSSPPPPPAGQTEPGGAASTDPHADLPRWTGITDRDTVMNTTIICHANKAFQLNWHRVTENNIQKLYDKLLVFQVDYG